MGGSTGSSNVNYVTNIQASDLLTNQWATYTMVGGFVVSFCVVAITLMLSLKTVIGRLSIFDAESQLITLL